MGRIPAEHCDLAGRGLPEPFEDLDRGGLAGPVRPEEREDLSGGDLEIDACHSFERAVALAEATDADHCVHGGILRVRLLRAMRHTSHTGTVP